MFETSRKLVQRFGKMADHCFTASEILMMIPITRSNFRLMIETGKFPRPDLVSSNLRGWRVQTLAKYDRKLVKRLIRVKLLYQ